MHCAPTRATAQHHRFADATQKRKGATLTFLHFLLLQCYNVMSAMGLSLCNAVAAQSVCQRKMLL